MLKLNNDGMLNWSLMRYFFYKLNYFLEVYEYQEYACVLLSALHMSIIKRCQGWLSPFGLLMTPSIFITTQRTDTSKSKTPTLWTLDMPLTLHSWHLCMVRSMSYKQTQLQMNRHAIYGYTCEELGACHAMWINSNIIT